MVLRKRVQGFDTLGKTVQYPGYADPPMLDWQPLRDSVLATILASFAIHFVLILFGAPFTR
jgi:hypothetical protein